jgi:hypothetical protein
MNYLRSPDIIQKKDILVFTDYFKDGIKAL